MNVTVAPAGRLEMKQLVSNAFGWVQARAGPPAWIIAPLVQFSPSAADTQTLAIAEELVFVAVMLKDAWLPSATWEAVGAELMVIRGADAVVRVFPLVGAGGLGVRKPFPVVAWNARALMKPPKAG